MVINILLVCLQHIVCLYTYKHKHVNCTKSISTCLPWIQKICYRGRGLQMGLKSALRFIRFWATDPTF